MSGRAPDAGGDTRVRVAEYAVASDGTLSSIGLGSCVAIALYDPDRAVAGLAHVLLPERAMARDGSSPAKFAETAVPALLAAMERLGASRDRVVAKIAGGASMFASLLATSGVNVGERNVVAVRAALAAAGIPLRAEDTGGEHGRSVFLRVCDGGFEVRSLRRGTHVL